MLFQKLQFNDVMFEFEKKFVKKIEFFNKFKKKLKTNR